MTYAELCFWATAAGLVLAVWSLGLLLPLLYMLRLI